LDNIRVFRNERASAKCSKPYDEVITKVSIENCQQVVEEERYWRAGVAGHKI
jgi:hypothetical protein